MEVKAPAIGANARVCAATAITDVLNGQSLDSAIAKVLVTLDDREHGFLKELCFGVTRYFYRLDTQASAFLSKPIKKKETLVKSLILIGLYQMQYMRVPDHAAISSCVDAARLLKKQWATKLINAVLRNFQRARDNIDNTIDSKDPVYQYTHPLWLIQRLQKHWPEHWQTILSNNNHQAPMSLRINKRHHCQNSYLNVLAQAGIRARASAVSLDGIILEQPCNIEDVPGFTEGMISVQDEAAQLAASLLTPEAGERILDACCAPGGKTCHILEKKPELSSITAIDCDALRMERVHENLERLNFNQLDYIKTAVANIEELDTWWDGKAFDRILLDAPCSATGVIRRHPDIKLLRRDSDIAKLSTLQAHLLAKLWQTLKTGGRLVYATCSVLYEENEAVVKSFVETHNNAKVIAIDTDWGIACKYGRQLFPKQHSHDGFYYAVLEKQY